MSKHQILVVDDDVDFADSLVDLLTAEKYQAKAVYSGAAAVDCFKSGEFDYALVDIKMPVMNGYETLMAIKDIRDDAKVIMMTGFSAQELIDQAVKHGALSVFRKPIDAKALLEAIKKN
jgi:DNA-binding NtrC family response regulator